MTEPTVDPEPTPGWDQKPSRFDPLHDRKAMGVVGGAVLVAVALGLFVIVPRLSGGGSTASSDGVVVHHHVGAGTRATPSPTASPAPSYTEVPVLGVRDPFSPLYAPAVATAGSSTGTSASLTPSSGSLVGGSPQPTVTTTVLSTKPTYTLVLQRVVSTRTGEILVSLNGKSLDLHDGQEFPSASDGPFQYTGLVTSVNGNAEDRGPALFAYGDSSFSMLAGETQTES